MMRASFVFLLVAVAAGCATNAERAAVVSAVHGGRVDVGVDAPPRKVTLQFEAKKPGARPLAAPFLEVKAGSETVRFLLDTSATTHAIDTSVAKSTGLAAPVKGTSLTIEGWGALPDQAIAITDLPPSLRSHGIGGVIAPQLLAKALPAGQAIALDFVRSQLRAQPKTAAWASAEELGLALTGSSQRFCANGSGIALDATLDGEATKLALDTAASRSFLAQGSKASAKIAARPATGRSVTSVGVAEVAVDLHGGVPFTIGSWSSTGEVGVSILDKDAACGTEGHLGMDILTRCALAMTADELVLGCRQPVPR